MTQINFKQIGPGDFIFEADGYCLRLEKMDHKKYWWNVCYNGEDVDGSNYDAHGLVSQPFAKVLCGLAYVRHNAMRQRTDEITFLEGLKIWLPTHKITDVENRIKQLNPPPPETIGEAE